MTAHEGWAWPQSVHDESRWILTGSVRVLSPSGPALKCQPLIPLLIAPTTQTGATGTWIQLQFLGLSSGAWLLPGPVCTWKFVCASVCMCVLFCLFAHMCWMCSCVCACVSVYPFVHEDVLVWYMCMHVKVCAHVCMLACCL